MVARQRSCLDFGLHVHFFSPFVGVSGPNRTAGRQVLTNENVVVAGHPSGLYARFHFHDLLPFLELLFRPECRSPGLTNHRVVIAR